MAPLPTRSSTARHRRRAHPASVPGGYGRGHPGMVVIRCDPSEMEPWTFVGRPGDRRISSAEPNGIGTVVPSTFIRRREILPACRRRGPTAPGGSSHSDQDGWPPCRDAVDLTRRVLTVAWFSRRRGRCRRVIGGEAIQRQAPAAAAEAIPGWVVIRCDPSEMEPWTRSHWPSFVPFENRLWMWWCRADGMLAGRP